MLNLPHVAITFNAGGGGTFLAQVTADTDRPPLHSVQLRPADPRRRRHKSPRLGGLPVVRPNQAVQ